MLHPLTTLPAASHNIARAKEVAEEDHDNTLIRLERGGGISLITFNKVHIILRLLCQDKEHADYESLMRGRRASMPFATHLRVTGDIPALTLAERLLLAPCSSNAEIEPCADERTSHLGLVSLLHCVLLRG